MSIRLFDPNQGGVLVVPNWPNSGSPTSGTTGTLAGFTQPGDLLHEDLMGFIEKWRHASVSQRLQDRTLWDDDPSEPTSEGAEAAFADFDL